MKENAPEQRYVFDQDWEDERARLVALQGVLDPHSISILEACGIEPGWRCLDVGAGGGSLTRWICRRVAPSGSVLAVDLDVRMLSMVEESNLEVRQADLFSDDFPRAEFDLVHCRYVLEHLPERDRGLAQLIGAAKPGGMVVISDSGGRMPELDQEDDVFTRGMQAFRDAVGQRGWDFDFAPTLAGRMRASGLENVAGQVYRTHEIGSAEGWTQVVWYGFNRMREAMVATGLVSDAEVETIREFCHDPTRGQVSPETWTAWGRRPG